MGADENTHQPGMTMAEEEGGHYEMYDRRFAFHLNVSK
jgi:hypothetical protein